MPLYAISIIVLSGAVIGRILGLRIRMRENPELQEKGFKAFFLKLRILTHSYPETENPPDNGS